MSDSDTQPPELPDWFVAKLQSVTAKRAKTVIDHIREHGYITRKARQDLPSFVKNVLRRRRQ